MLNDKMIYNEGWGQSSGTPYPEERLTQLVRRIDPSRLVDSVSGWYDHGYGDFSVSLRAFWWMASICNIGFTTDVVTQDNHHYANPQCGTPFYSLLSSPHDPTRIGFQGEFGGIGHVVGMDQYVKHGSLMLHMLEFSCHDLTGFSACGTFNKLLIR